MAGCTSRCRQGVLKLIQSLQRLVSGTLTKGIFKYVPIPVCCQRFCPNIFIFITFTKPPGFLPHALMSSGLSNFLFFYICSKNKRGTQVNDVVIPVYKQRAAAIFRLLLILYQLCHLFSILPPFKYVTGCYAILLLLHKKLLAAIKVRFWFILPQANSAANSCGVLAGFIFDSSFSVCGEVEHAWLSIPAASKPAGLLSSNVFEWLSAVLMFLDSADLLKAFCQVSAEMLRWNKDNPADIILVFGTVGLVIAKIKCGFCWFYLFDI